MTLHSDDLAILSVSSNWLSLATGGPAGGDGVTFHREAALHFKQQRLEELQGRYLKGIEHRTLEALSVVLVPRKAVRYLPRELEPFVDVMFDHRIPMHAFSGVEACTSSEPEPNGDTPVLCNDVVIGFIDSGLAPHDEFSSSVVTVARCSADGTATIVNPPRDTNGHGTAVSALAAGRTKGLAVGAHIAMASVFDGDDASVVAVLTGLDWLTKTRFVQTRQGVDVINISAGTERSDSRYYHLFNEIRLSGVLSIAAIGNEGVRQGTDSPADYNTVVGVGSTWLRGGTEEVFYGTDWGVGKPDLCAPGVDVRSAWHGGGYTTLTGTSYATPLVSGACGRLLHHHPSLRDAPSRLADKLFGYRKSVADPDRRSRLGALDLGAIARLA